MATSDSLATQDNTSASGMSTPHTTDLSDSLQTPETIPFQSLVEAAATQALFNAANSSAWDMSCLGNAYAIANLAAAVRCVR